MEEQTIVVINVYDEIEKSTTEMSVEQIGENLFRMVENDMFNNQLTRGTEFKTVTNQEENHEIVEIIKASEFITRRFFLSPRHTEREYTVLVEKLLESGGYWQVDFSSIVTVNIPQNFDFEEALKEFNIYLDEIVEK